MKRIWQAAVILSMLTFASSTQAKEVQLKLKNGLTVLGNLELAEGKTLQDDGVILLVHGTLAHKDMGIITTQREFLNEREINVLAVNLSLGLDKRSGMYDCKVPHTHKHSDALNEIEAWMTWLKDKGVSRVVIMGHSRGGNQVARYMAAHEDDGVIGAAVLVAPQTWSVEHNQETYQKNYKKDLAGVFAIMKAKAEAGKGQEMVEKTDFIYCPQATVTPDSFVNYYRNDEMMNTPTVLKSITKPVLVVAGSNDKVVADLAEQMKDVNQANVTFSVVEEADHMFIDFAGEDLADQVAEFFLAE